MKKNVIRGWIPIVTHAPLLSWQLVRADIHYVAFFRDFRIRRNDSKQTIIFLTNLLSGLMRKASKRTQAL
jgi:hypothetical protein